MNFKDADALLISMQLLNLINTTSNLVLSFMLSVIS